MKDERRRDEIESERNTRIHIQIKTIVHLFLYIYNIPV